MRMAILDLFILILILATLTLGPMMLVATGYDKKAKQPTRVDKILGNRG
jgi:nitrate reductase gamma subunit|tara:strand:+ start:505 stop:651 length:147 start_codon:yes stop_codon:yes gene_type:complete